MRAKQRITSATITSANNTIRLIQILREHPESTTGDLSHYMHLSLPGMRKYLADLREAGVLMQKLQDGTTRGVLLFWLTDDNDKLGALLEQLQQYTSTPEQRAAIERRKTARMAEISKRLLPGSYIHIAKDDGTVTLPKYRNAEVHVHRDPLDIAFFGTGPAPSVVTDVEMQEAAS